MDSWTLLAQVMILLAGVLYLVLVKVAVRACAALASERNREPTVLLAVVVGLGSTWAAHFAGPSPALGAFVAGMFLGGSPFATRVRADVGALRTVLVTIFFAAAGMVADPVWIWRHAPLVLGVSAIVLLGTAVVVGEIGAWVEVHAKDARPVNTRELHEPLLAEHGDSRHLKVKAFEARLRDELRRACQAGAASRRRARRAAGSPSP